MLRFSLPAALLILTLGICETFGQRSYLPHDEITFADWVSGEGWSVQLAIYNLSPSVALQGWLYSGSEQGTVDLFSLNAGALPDFSVPRRGTLVLSSSARGKLRRGYLVVNQENDPGIFGGKMLDAVLTYRHTNGVEVTVPAFRNRDDSAYGGEPSEAIIFVEETKKIGTGVAINKGPSTIICMSLLDEQGDYLIDREGSGQICYDERWEHRARTIPEWFRSHEPDGLEIPAGFMGSLRISTHEDTSRCCLQFVAVGLRFSKDPNRPSLSSVPVSRRTP